MISDNKKINAYYNAIKFAHRQGKTDKCFVLSNKLHKLEKAYWDNLLKPKAKRKTVSIPHVESSLLNHDFTLLGLTGIDYQGLPKIAFNSSINYFGTRLQETKKSKPKQREKRYRTIIRRKTRHGKTLSQRYKIEQKDYIYLLSGAGKYKRSQPITRRDNVTYIQIDRYRQITDYLESITLHYLYTEKIRTAVICKLCSAKNSLLSYENSLGCSKCSRVAYDVRTYRIRYYYFSNYVRYELNELTGKVKKQIETNNGYKTVFSGSITKT